MRPFFTGVLPNFDFTDAKDQTIARLIVLIEQLLTRHGVIPNYHTSIVGRRRDVKRPPLTSAETARITFTTWNDAGAPVDPVTSGGGLRRVVRRVLRALLNRV
jgi:hypothetical protein